ncbi:flagellar basal body protein [Rhizobiaceae bacterium n13]|uniref:Flagellar basal body protein n=1 Tax=Ferirhizobium litorale TaxID=2927786 RepID=A0AAE3U2S4_9HYPH|nr:flagellar basal body protein [Fererhizobium litorale]MDI7863274.1 flagellar basal body protein [Fererhizobium litorale]MDI7922992.1 flagellar basal body protein [Fererhizobium litorale]
MSISTMMGIAVSGMQVQTKRLAATADNVANALTPGYDRRVTSLTSLAAGGASASVRPSGETTLPGASNVDLGQEMLDLISAETEFKANASAFETGAELWDVLMSIKRD